MENASKALLMAAGVLIGILILSLMVALFASSSSFSRHYDETKQSEAIQQFNSKFTKYIGKDLTIHQVVTITNFANKYGVTVVNGKQQSNIIEDVSAYSNRIEDIKTYKLQVIDYDADGYVKKIQFN